MSAVGKAVHKARHAAAKAIDSEEAPSLPDVTAVARHEAFSDAIAKIVADVHPRDPSVEKILGLLRTMAEE